MLVIIIIMNKSKGNKFYEWLLLC